jgi:DnaJ like chaperone protein
MLIALIGAVLGLLFAGVPGLLIGAIIGYALGASVQSALMGGARFVQSNFLDAMFAVMGALCKADGVVTRNEIAVAEEIFRRLHLSEAQRRAAQAAFNRGKAPGFDLEAEVDKIRVIGYGRGPLFTLFLQIQCTAVAANGTVHPAEHAMLVRVARRLGLTERDVAQLEALLRAAAAGPSARQGPSPQSRLEDAYTALGLTPTASVTEIKRAYRKLVSENHPDKLAAQGLPGSMREVAEQRTREINVAYELIKQARKFP